MCAGTELDIARRQVRALFYCLAAHLQPVARDDLVFLFWPDTQEASARRNLTQILSHLRRALPHSDMVLTTQTHVQLDPARIWSDVATFEGLYAADTDAAQPAERLYRAITLYTGPFLAGASSAGAEWEAWVREERRRFEQRYLNALTICIGDATARGAYEDAIALAQRYLDVDELAEEMHRRLIKLYAMTGDRPAALQQYERCAALLGRELDVDPLPETRAAYEAVRDGRATNLPVEPTPLIGRERDVATVSALLRQDTVWLVTLTGPGGCGKTRLALTVAHELLAEFSHGVFFVSLAAIRSPGHVISVIAQTLGVQESGRQSVLRSLQDYLHDKDILLILDNFEQVVDAAAEIARLRSRAAGLKVLVTSRTQLHVRGEKSITVPPLATPDPDATVSPDDAAQYPAVRLFVERARDTNLDFVLSEENRDAVVEICARLGGLPLAIELAAVWVSILPCAEIAEEIKQNLDLMETPLRDVPDRHRSIRAAFDHSWELLTEHERIVFSRLSVFRGGFDREAVSAVAEASLPALATLAGKSLLQRTPADRYELHELLRQYAEEKLDGRPEDTHRTRDRHGAYYLQWIARAEARLQGSEQRTTLEEIDREVENVRAAWHWAAEHAKSDLLADSSHGLWLFYEITGRYREGETAFADAAATLGGWDTSPAQQAIAYGKIRARQAACQIRLGRLDDGRNALADCIEHFRRLGERDELAFCLNLLAVVAHRAGAYVEEQKLLQESLELFRAVENRWGVAYSLNDLGKVARLQSDYEAAEHYLHESLSLFREIGDQRGMAFAFDHLGALALDRGRYQDAGRLYQKSLEIRREIGNQWGMATSRIHLGVVAGIAGADGDAQTHLRDALRIALDIRALPEVLKALVELAEICMRRQEYEMARAILVPARGHPATTNGVKRKAERLLSELNISPPYRTSAEQDSTRAIEALAKELLARGSYCSGGETNASD